MVSYAFFAYGFAHRDGEPVAAHEALRRGLRIAQDSDNRQTQSNLAVSMSGLAATHGDPVDALDFLTLAIRNYHDSGGLSLMPLPLAIAPVATRKYQRVQR